MDLRRAPPQPPQKTLADYLGIAVGPVLIILMVGSLVFFLLQIGYRGQFSDQAQWTLFWFTLAAVLISRISIEQGTAYGRIYGLALGAATAFRLVAFLGTQISVLVLLGVIWWCASKLVWDCTYIEDDDDASGQGLLQQAGFESGEGDSEPPSGASPARAAAARSKRPHAPGLWVIYFSLGALPIFGIGQWTIPVTDAAGRWYGFCLAWIFVAAALALLLTTSFLGLRRYLRQRHLTMPTAMAGAWMTLGGLMVGGVLLAALFLPRPRGWDTLAGAGFGLSDASARASRFAWMKSRAAEGEGRAIGRGEGARGQAGANSGSGDGKSAKGDHGAESDGHSGASGRDTQGAAPEGQGSGNAAGDDGTSGESSDRGAAARQPGAGGSAVANSGDPLRALRLLSLLLAVLALIYLLFRFGPGWLAAMRKAWAERPRTPAATAPAPIRPAAFADYRNPFTSGDAAHMSPAELTAYTFEALQAWAEDAGRGRRVDQTPLEFGEVLAEGAPEWSAELRGAIRLYLGVAYGGVQPCRESTGVLERLWSVLPAR